MKHIKLIIAGGRDFTNSSAVAKQIGLIVKREGLKGPDQITVISGCARGADTVGAQVARKNNITVIEYPAQWDTYGKSAGYRRNEQMAKAATHLLAFWDGNSRGTAHMIEYARKCGLDVTVSHYNN